MGFIGRNAVRENVLVCALLSIPPFPPDIFPCLEIRARWPPRRARPEGNSGLRLKERGIEDRPQMDDPAEEHNPEQPGETEMDERHQKPPLN